MTDSSPSTTPNGAPIRVAVIGYGVGGRLFHAPLVSGTPGLELAAVVTRNPASVAEVRGRYGVPALGSADEIWADADSYDAVVVSTPNLTHVPLATQAIELGLAVVVDKPLAPTAAQARDLVALAAARGVPITVFQNRRWDGDFRTVEQLVRSGRLGEVLQFESRFTWWQPEGRPGWKGQTTPEDGGGALYDLGPHLIDQAVRLFGPVASSYAELDARHATSRNDDDSFVSLTHESGVRTRLWLSSLTAQAGPRFRLVGSAAGFTVRGLDPQEAQAAAGMRADDPQFGVRTEPGTLGADGQETAVPIEPGRYLGFYEAFAAALRDGAPLPVEPAESIATLELIESLHQRFGLTTR